MQVPPISKISQFHICYFYRDRESQERNEFWGLAIQCWPMLPPIAKSGGKKQGKKNQVCESKKATPSLSFMI